MIAIDILRGARALLEDPNHWVKGAHAQSQDGQEVPPLDSIASCWCLDGATYKVEGTDGSHPPSPEHAAVDELLMEASAELFPARISGWDASFVNFNDHPDTEHADVLAVVDFAIKKAEDL